MRFTTERMPASSDERCTGISLCSLSNKARPQSSEALLMGKSGVHALITKARLVLGTEEASMVDQQPKLHPKKYFLSYDALLAAIRRFGT